MTKEKAVELGADISQQTILAAIEEYNIYRKEGGKIKDLKPETGEVIGVLNQKIGPHDRWLIFERGIKPVRPRTLIERWGDDCKVLGDKLEREKETSL